MGKGDIKSKKGKMANGSFGNKRRRNETKLKVQPAKALAEVGAETTETKPKAKAKKAEK